jgi:hypothetical protein
MWDQPQSFAVNQGHAVTQSRYTRNVEELQISWSCSTKAVVHGARSRVRTVGYDTKRLLAKLDQRTYI